MSNYKIDYASLEQSLIDIVQEEQIKLGYRKEKINLFYPASSVNNLLGTDVKSEELYELLKDFNDASTQRLGNVEYTRKGDRFCFIISESGTEYVHKNANDGGFLKNFIDTISRHGCSIEDIRKIFSEYSDEYMCQKEKHGEFDYLLYFNNGQPDRYMYCVKFEGEHAIYHRFTKKDYEDFDF